MNKITAVLCSLVFAGVMMTAGWSPASDWPQFRGPGGQGVSTETGLPTEWNESKNLKWKLDLPGEGSSSPIVYGDKLFVTCYSGGSGNAGNLNRHLLCITSDTGEIVWSKEIPATVSEDGWSGYLREHGYASHTPVCDGEHVFVFCGKTGMVVFDMDGNEVWRKNLGTSSANRRWGSGASPILYEDLLIVNASEESRTLYALDKATGKEIWKYESRQLELAYGTPALAELPDGSHELVVSLPFEVWGFNPKTGERLWSVSTSLSGNVSPSSLAVKDKVYVMGGYPRITTVAIQAGGKGDVTDSRVLWTSRDSSYVPSPVEHDGYLYWVDHKGFAYCVEAESGTLVYKEKLDVSGGGNPVYASATLADGKLYVPSRQDGIFVIEATPKFKLIEQNLFKSDASDFNGSAAVSDGKLFFRSNERLYCVSTEK
jgi:outer membrane protein assembly factor BamB